MFIYKVKITLVKKLKIALLTPIEHAFLTKSCLTGEMFKIN